MRFFPDSYWTSPTQRAAAERAYREARDAERCTCGHSRLVHHTYHREDDRNACVSGCACLAFAVAS